MPTFQQLHDKAWGEGLRKKAKLDLNDAVGLSKGKGTVRTALQAAKDGQARIDKAYGFKKGK